jgi:hypothetical protein
MKIIKKILLMVGLVIVLSQKSFSMNFVKSYEALSLIKKIIFNSYHPIAYFIRNKFKFCSFESNTVYMKIYERIGSDRSRRHNRYDDEKAYNFKVPLGAGLFGAIGLAQQNVKAAENDDEDILYLSHNNDCGSEIVMRNKKNNYVRIYLQNLEISLKDMENEIHAWLNKQKLNLNMRAVIEQISLHMITIVLFNELTVLLELYAQWMLKKKIYNELVPNYVQGVFQSLQSHNHDSYYVGIKTNIDDVFLDRRDMDKNKEEIIKLIKKHLMRDDGEFKDIEILIKIKNDFIIHNIETRKKINLMKGQLDRIIDEIDVHK